MKTISIYDLQRNPAKALEELPVTITRYGKKWRLVTGLNIDNVTLNKPATKLSEEFNEFHKLCPHGSPIGSGLCRKGCK